MQTHQDIWFSVNNELEHIFFRVEEDNPEIDPFLDFIPWGIKVPKIIFPDGTFQTTAASGGGGQNQTPWLSDIDAAGFSLNNVSNIEAFNNGLTIGPGSANVIIYASFLDLQVNNRIRMFTNSGVGIGTNPQFALDVNGDINTSGEYLINGVPIGGSQTPWLSDIDANGFSLNNVFSIEGLAEIFLAAQTVNIGNLSANVNVLGGGLTLHGNGGVSIFADFGPVVMPNMPTSPPGFPGALWNNNGVVNIT
jgi:hypothetical protein